jgi:hypothetical protein
VGGLFDWSVIERPLGHQHVAVLRRCDERWDVRDLTGENGNARHGSDPGTHLESLDRGEERIVEGIEDGARLDGGGSAPAAP